MQNLITFIAGQRGSGKTTLALRISEDARRVLALDCMGQYGPEHGFTVVHDLEPSVRAMLAARELRRFKLACRLRHADDYLQLCRLAYEIPDHLLVVEEASFYCSPHQLPDEISQLLRYGRHRRIDQLYIARRPFEIHREITAQSDVGVSFVQYEPNDIRYLCSVAGPQAEGVRALPRYRALVWGDVERAPLAAIEAADIVLDRRAAVAAPLPPSAVTAADDPPAPDGAPE